MTLSKRKPATAPDAVPAAEKPAAPAARRAAAVPASKTAAKPKVSPTQATAAKPPRKAEPKEKRIRSSYTLPESQIALLGELKKKCLAFGVNVKKGELLAAGLQLLKNLPESALEASVLPSIRSDRKPAVPKKRKK